MAEQGNFRTALNGFNKTDVLEYIDAMQSRSAYDVRMLQQQIDDLLNTQKSLQADYDNIRNQIETVENESNVLKAENDRLKQTTQDKVRYAADIRRLAQEVEILRLEKKEYSTRLSELQAYATEKEQLEHQVDKLHNQIEQNAAMQERESVRIEEINRLNSEKQDLLEKLKELQERAELATELQYQIEELRIKLEQSTVMQESESSRIEETDRLSAENQELLEKLKEAQERAELVSALQYQVEQLRIQLEQSTAIQESESSRVEEINRLNAENQDMLEKLKEARERADFANDLQYQVEELRTKYERLAAEQAEVTPRNDEKNLIIDSLQTENMKLVVKLEIAQNQINEMQSQLNKAGETNQRYNGLVGDAGAFIMEMYSMGQRFLEIAYKRSDGCLDSMEASLSTLAVQTNEARDKVKSARQELLDYGAMAGLKLDELMQTLEESAGIIPETETIEQEVIREILEENNLTNV